MKKSIPIDEWTEVTDVDSYFQNETGNELYVQQSILAPTDLSNAQHATPYTCNVFEVDGTTKLWAYSPIVIGKIAYNAKV